MRGSSGHSAAQRFWLKVRFTPSCWHWEAATNKLGYGSFRGPAGTIGAHQFAWELLVGPRTSRMHLDHLCRNPSCVNPLHLEEVTPGENIRRGSSFKGGTAADRCIHGHPANWAYYKQRYGKRRVCLTCNAERMRSR